MMLKDVLNSIESNQFLIEIFGLGYVGFPLAIRLAKSGLNVHGIDINTKRLERFESENLYESEVDLKKEFLECRKNGKLEISNIPNKTDYVKVGIICVPTPIPDQNTKSTIYVKSAVENFLSSSKKGDVIILESSIEIGTTEEIKKLIESKGYEVGKDFGLCFCPERIDPANKEWGIENISRVIYCSDDITYEICKKIYLNVNGGNLFRVNNSKIAEVVKSFENTFRLVNISLVNELAILCEKLGINVKEVINAASTKPFGFLPHYPGAGAGGHCIPKDPRFLLESSKKFGLDFQTIKYALKINLEMPSHICNSIENKMKKLNLERSVIVCGLSYKANVEDMRDSASFKIISELKKRNFNVVGYDPFFNNDLIGKYCIENNLRKLNFEVIKNLNDEIIKQFNCICIVQHHDISKNRINEIYQNSLLPYIYDCQNKLEFIPSSKSNLESLGSSQN